MKPDLFRWNMLVDTDLNTSIIPNKIPDRRIEIVKVIFNNPATIVYWSDGTKTVVKVHNEEFDKEKGLAMAMVKRMTGNDARYKADFKKWCKD